MEFVTHNVENTIELGENLGKLLKKGDIICLTGDLGTGKTHFVKGIAKGLQINDYITSPTFTLVNEYEGRLKLYHFDVYRIDDPAEIESIGFDEYIMSDAVSVIEWAELIDDLIPYEHLHVYIEKLPEEGDLARKISITSKGERYNHIREILQ